MSMAQYKITLESTILHDLFLGGAENEGVKKLLESVLNQVLQAQATEQLAADPYERTDERRGYRNGSYPHLLKTRVGTITLQVPRLRNGQFSTELFARYQRSEQAFVLAMMEMVIQGVSTRKVTAITEELCGVEFSKSTVSELCKKLDPMIIAWNSRPLRAKRYPFVFVDAIVLKIREEDGVRPRGMLVAVGINDAGQREVLGFRLDDSESEASWRAFFQWLKQRGLACPDLIVSDCHGGLVRAIRTNFQGVLWQRCQTHFMRNIWDAAPKSMQKELHSRVKAALHAPDATTARQLVQSIYADFSKATKALKILEQGFEDAITVLLFPEEYRQRLRTTNGVERLNEEIRRRERVIRIFPNRASAERLLGTLLMEHSEKWLNGKRYLNLSEYDARRTATKLSLSPVVRIM